MSKLLAASVYQEVFFYQAVAYYLLAQLNNLEISCRGIKTYSTNVAFQRNALTNHTSKSFRLHQAI